MKAWYNYLKQHPNKNIQERRRFNKSLKGWRANGGKEEEEKIVWKTPDSAADIREDLITSMHTRLKGLSKEVTDITKELKDIKNESLLYESYSCELEKAKRDQKNATENINDYTTHTNEASAKINTLMRKIKPIINATDDEDLKQIFTNLETHITHMHQIKCNWK